MRFFVCCLPIARVTSTMGAGAADAREEEIHGTKRPQVSKYYISALYERQDTSLSPTGKCRGEATC